jgi:hypothetical protein
MHKISFTFSDTLCIVSWKYMCSYISAYVSSIYQILHMSHYFHIAGCCSAHLLEVSYIFTSLNCAHKGKFVWELSIGLYVPTLSLDNLKYMYWLIRKLIDMHAGSILWCDMIGFSASFVFSIPDLWYYEKTCTCDKFWYQTRQHNRWRSHMRTPLKGVLRAKLSITIKRVYAGIYRNQSNTTIILYICKLKILSPIWPSCSSLARALEVLSR